MEGEKAALVGLALLAASTPAYAFPHVVSQKETLAAISMRMYGTPRYEGLLAAANALDAQGGSAIVSGMRLEIPAPAHWTVTAGDTWPTLAERWLGDARRADLLARANAAVPWVPPSDGEEVVIPYVLTIVAAEGERIDSLAAKYLGEPNAAWQISAFNFRKGVELRRADVILVPILDLPLTADGRSEAVEGLAAERSAAAGVIRESQQKIETELPSLVGDVSGGRYVEAVAKGTKLLARQAATRSQIATIQRALLESFVALDAPGAAQVACAAWKAAAPDAKLDPITVSPKIRSACNSR